MNLSSDQTVFWHYGFAKINETIVTTWVLMAVLVVCSHIVSRRLSTGFRISKGQSVLEIVVEALESQISEIGLPQPRQYLPFLGTLFLFLAFAALCTIFPGYQPPSGSLSTTAALAMCVFVAVPAYGIKTRGLRGYLRSYTEPTFLMLPFNIISELTRTLALAVRLFGNMMSGAMILAILLTVTPLIFPVFMNVLGLLTGLVQAYIFSVLATVYIGAAAQSLEAQANLRRETMKANG